ncbi:hypothetical protein GQ53DRAFT_419940 [Thozetella sp. PMI_491]|nr:hypothetical protein GQ53DRAFT_419940 [Thozetella sp. PMI_491]
MHHGRPLGASSRDIMAPVSLLALPTHEAHSIASSYWRGPEPPPFSKLLLPSFFRLLLCPVGRAAHRRSIGPQDAGRMANYPPSLSRAQPNIRINRASFYTGPSLHPQLPSSRPWHPRSGMADMSLVYHGGISPMSLRRTRHMSALGVEGCVGGRECI